MSVECVNLKIYKGATKSWILYFTKLDLAQDITGWTIYMTVKTNHADTDENAVINKKITSHTDATAGKTTISLSKTDTDLLGQYYYSIDYKDDVGNEGPMFEGRFQVKRSTRITRD